MGQVNKLIVSFYPAFRRVLTVFLVSLLVHPAAFGAGEAIEVKVIHATRSGTSVDAELKSLVADFAKLKFTSFKTLDRARIELVPGSSSSFQLPNGLWIEVGLQDKSEQGGWRIFIKAKKLQFKSVIAISPGGTVAVGGPVFKGGALIFALSRTKRP